MIECKCTIKVLIKQDITCFAFITPNEFIFQCLCHIFHAHILFFFTIDFSTCIHTSFYTLKTIIRSKKIWGGTAS